VVHAPPGGAAGKRIISGAESFLPLTAGNS
jgi:hypothetical protein